MTEQLCVKVIDHWNPYCTTWHWDVVVDAGSRCLVSKLNGLDMMS